MPLALGRLQEPPLIQKADLEPGENAYWAAIFSARLTDNNEVVSDRSRELRTLPFARFNGQVASDPAQLHVTFR
jgi:hypothetical protein